VVASRECRTSCHSREISLCCHARVGGHPGSKKQSRPSGGFSFVSPAGTHTCGWLTHGRFLFFACAKKRNQKKHTPERANTPSVPRPTGRSTNSPGAKMYGKTSERSEQGYIFAPRARTRSRLKIPGGAAVLGAHYGVD
jgi:hypothetical protein